MHIHKQSCVLTSSLQNSLMTHRLQLIRADRVGHCVTIGARTRSSLGVKFKLENKDGTLWRLNTGILSSTSSIIAEDTVSRERWIITRYSLEMRSPFSITYDNYAMFSTLCTLLWRDNHYDTILEIKRNLHSRCNTLRLQFRARLLWWSQQQWFSSKMRNCHSLLIILTRLINNSLYLNQSYLKWDR